MTVETTRVVLAVDASPIADAIVDFLDRSGTVRVVASASDHAQAAAAIRQSEPDAVIASPALLGAVQRVGVTTPVVVVDTSATTGALREALAAGVVAFVEWPDERSELLSALEHLAPSRAPSSGPRGEVVGVVGARGGAGATFVATHLADALARGGSGSVILVDGDFAGAGAAVALGASRVADLRSAQDLVPVLGELGAAHLDEVLWDHPRGFRVLLPPKSPQVGADLSADALVALVDAAAASCGTVVIDLPRIPSVVSGLRAFESTLLVVLSLDVGAFACASRLRQLIGDDDVSYVVNRAGRSEVSPDDVLRIFGQAPLGVLPTDRRILGLQDRGRLASPRSALARNFDKIVTQLNAPREVAA